MVPLNAGKSRLAISARSMFHARIAKCKGVRSMLQKGSDHVEAREMPHLRQEADAHEHFEWLYEADGWLW